MHFIAQRQCYFVCFCIFSVEVGSCESVNVDPASRENLVKCKTECLGGEMENNAVIRDLEISRRLQEFFAELPARKQ